MKRGLKVFIGLACFCLFALPVIAQPSSKSIETFVLDDFDNPNGQDYAYGSKRYNWDWTVNSSRYVAEGYPKTGYYDGIPNSLKQLRRDGSFVLVVLRELRFLVLKQLSTAREITGLKYTLQ